MANTVYAAEVIRSKAKDLLITKVNTRNLMTVDTDLEQEAGMKKVVNLYTYSGEAEALAKGEGNTSSGSISYVPKEYVVKTIQQKFDYYDEDVANEPNTPEMMLKGATEVMTNKMAADFTAAITSSDITNKITLTGDLSYDAIVDAISEVNVEDESELFIVIPNAWKAALRKDPDYISARMGEVVYNGMVGIIAGIPVIASKALDDAKMAAVMSKEAVTLFLKKDIEVETARDIDTRDNTVVLRTAYLVALTNADKICKIGADDESE